MTVFSSFALISCSKNSDDNSKSFDLQNFQPDTNASITVKNTVVNQCLKIESIGESDGVLCVSVQNVSQQDIEYCVLNGKAGDEDVAFSFSVLPAGKSAVAIEQNGLKYKKKTKFGSWNIENRVDFNGKFSLCEDVFDIRCDGDCIEIKSRIANDIDGEIKICYKNFQSEKLFTCEAFLISADGLKSGETKQLFPKHFDAQNSRIIYIEYEK